MQYAAKLEPFKPGKDTKVQLEYELLSLLAGIKYVPNVYEVRPQTLNGEIWYILILDLQGPNL